LAEGVILNRESVEKAAQEQKEQALAAIIAEVTRAIDVCIKARMFLAGHAIAFFPDALR
jgi:hypothetical protein